MKEKTHYENIFGKSEEDRNKFSEELKTMFEERSARLSEYETEKTEDDIGLITKAESAVDDFVSRYGGNPKPIPLDNIYILEPGSVLKITDGDISDAVFYHLSLKIGVDRSESNFLLASRLIHELLHLKSYKAARVSESGEYVYPYRSGLMMLGMEDKNDEDSPEIYYYGRLEEAVVAECTKRILDKINKEKIFEEELSNLNKIKSWVNGYLLRNGAPKEAVKTIEDEIEYIPNPLEIVDSVASYSNKEEERQSYAAGMINRMLVDGMIKTSSRYEERQALYELLDNLVDNSGGKIKTREEIFSEFAKANFSGNYLPLARITDEILGKGSFRRLAKEFSE